MEDEIWDDEVDPRIKGELERLNNASHQINLLEKDHEDAQEMFRLTLAQSASHLKSLYDKLGKKVDQARPYYETLNQTEHVHNESEQAAARYERACDNYNAAKDMVKKAEEKLKQDERFLDSACQEMLNHATIKVMDANQEKNAAERIHLEASQAFNEMQEKKTRLQKSLKSVIHKTRSYFELKEKFNKMLETHKRKVFKLQNDIIVAKKEYHTALRNLEVISDSIHERRSSGMNLLEPRGQGVGAENPDGACTVDSKSDRVKYGPGFEVVVDSPRTTERRIITEVTTELESAIKSLKLQGCASEQGRDCTPLSPESEQDLCGEITLSSSDSDNNSCDGTSSYSIPVTPPSKREGSTAMEVKLFVTPPSAENSDDDFDTGSVRLEKWFFFSPVADKNSKAIETNAT